MKSAYNIMEVERLIKENLPLIWISSLNLRKNSVMESFFPSKILITSSIIFAVMKRLCFIGLNFFEIGFKESVAKIHPFITFVSIRQLILISPYYFF